LSKGSALAAGLFFAGTAAVGWGVSTNRIEFADNRHTYDEGLSFATPFGGRLYLDDQPYTAEQERLLWSNLYHPTVQLTAPLAQSIVDRLVEVDGCIGDQTVKYVPEDNLEPSQEMKVCLDLGNAGVSGYTIVIPLRLEQIEGIPTQVIDFPTRTPECAELAYDYAISANGIVLEMLNESGTSVDPGTLVPLDIRMNNEKRDECDMSAVDSSVK